MLENFRRKSLSYTYNSLIHEIHFEQGHVIYKNLSSIGYHRTRYSKVEALKSFPNTFESVGKRFWVIYDMIGRVKFKMIYCPAGTFTMGYDSQENSKPGPEVIDKPFLLGETEVTEGLYSMGVYESSFPEANVSWFDAILFCNRLSKLKGLNECYEVSDIIEEEDENGDIVIWSASVSWDKSANGYRLPTEKEWEYAAKAGTENEWSGTNNKGDLENFAIYLNNSEINGREQRHPVATKKPNEWGFYDMSGNVWEWCYDLHESNSDKRVNRGGSFKNYADNLCFDANTPGRRFDSVGFRVCRSIVY